MSIKSLETEPKVSRLCAYSIVYKYVYRSL